MADKKIEDLPLLGEDDFNPATDFIIIQKPTGGTYKIQASKLMSDNAVREAFFDTKIVDLSYPISSHTHEFSSVLAFEEEGILALESSFNMEVHLHNVYNGSSVRGGNTALGLKESRIASKARGLTTTTIGVSTGSISDWQSFYRATYTGGGIDDLYMHYYLKYDFSDTNRIVLKFKAEATRQNSRNRHIYLPAQKVKIEAVINASIFLG